MAKEKPRKTLEELQREVMDSGSGLTSDEDLRVLFSGDEPVTEPTDAGTNKPAQQVAQQGAPVESAPVVPEPGATDVSAPHGNKESVLEAELAKRDGEIEKLRNLLEELKRPQIDTPTQPTQQVVKQEPEEDDGIDDTSIIEKPKETITKMLQRERAKIMEEAAKLVVAGLTHYDGYQSKKETLRRFRDAHPDFDSLRGEMATVLKEYPQLNNDPNALPKLYELAKQNVAKRTESLKKDVGIDKEQLKTEIYNEIVEGIRKRKAASGALPGSPPVSPDTRGNSEPKVLPLTPDEEILEAMLKSGPGKLKL